MKKLSLALAMLIGVPLSVNSQQLPTEKIQVRKAEGVWIDVRSADEFQQGHISGAVNIPHTDIVERISQVAPDKDQPINLYCRSGRRAELALTELKKLGYSNVTNYGGYDDLIKSGLK